MEEYDFSKLSENLFELFKIKEDNNIDLNTLKLNYKKLLKIYHPDKQKTQNGETNNKILLINAGYNILLNNTLREKYLDYLKKNLEDNFYNLKTSYKNREDYLPAQITLKELCNFGNKTFNNSTKINNKDLQNYIHERDNSISNIKYEKSEINVNNLYTVIEIISNKYIKFYNNYYKYNLNRLITIKLLEPFKEEKLEELLKIPNIILKKIFNNKILNNIIKNRKIDDIKIYMIEFFGTELIFRYNNKESIVNFINNEYIKMEDKNKINEIMKVKNKQVEKLSNFTNFMNMFNNKSIIKLLKTLDNNFSESTEIINKLNTFRCTDIQISSVDNDNQLILNNSLSKIKPIKVGENDYYSLNTENENNFLDNMNFNLVPTIISNIFLENKGTEKIKTKVMDKNLKNMIDERNNYINYVKEKADAEKINEINEFDDNKELSNLKIKKLLNEELTMIQK